MTKRFATVDADGDDWIVFASDYSHFDSRWPGVSQPIGMSSLAKQRSKDF